MDGYDNAPAVIDTITATSGRIRFGCIPRHGDGDFEKFGSPNPVVALAWFDANNLIWVYANTNTQWTGEIIVGGVATAAVWNPAGGITAANLDSLEFEYSAVQCIIRVNDVDRFTLIPGAGIDFGASIPNAFYPGSNSAGAAQFDAVYTAP